MSGDQRRLYGLDFLRGVAILLVLGRHVDSFPLIAIWHKAGWIGVDLFFGLSGFLVAGLLFGEYFRSGRVAVGRFLFRRALKIYPSYYVFLLVALSPISMTAGTLPFSRMALGHFLFLQNYTGIFEPALQLWSLAVEEHFYLLIAGAFACVSYFAWRRRSLRRWVGVTVPLTFVACLLLRLQYARSHPYNWTMNLTYTHFRLDSFMAGVFLAHRFQASREAFLAFCRRSRWLLGCAGLALLSVAVFRDIDFNPFMYVYGLTIISLGAALVLTACLGFPSLGRAGMSGGVSFVGRYSYSIYLWHMFAKERVYALMSSFHLGVGAGVPMLVACLGAEIGLGVALGKLIEMPVLAWRDRVAPRVRGAEGAATGVGAGAA